MNTDFHKNAKHLHDRERGEPNTLQGTAPGTSLTSAVALSASPQPNFFIVGAARAGTTSLWMYLEEHPDIYLPQAIEHKEPAYFCNIYGYRDFEKYLRLFSPAAGYQAIGEASTAYLTSPESARWIRSAYPEARIIILLRNPVERAYSLYRWMIQEGYEWIAPFEAALAVEESRSSDIYFKYHNPQYYYNYLYYSSGCYAEQVRRYLSIFPTSHVLVILLDDLQNSPKETLRQVYELLDVDTSFPRNFNVHNNSKVPLTVRAQFTMKQNTKSRLRRRAFRYLSSSARSALRSGMTLNLFLGGFRHTQLDEATRDGLKLRYRDDVNATSSLIDRDLDDWLT